MKQTKFLGLFLLAILCQPLLVSAQSSETKVLEELYQLNQLPILKTGTVTNMFSSYDRTGVIMTVSAVLIRNYGLKTATRSSRK